MGQNYERKKGEKGPRRRPLTEGCRLRRGRRKKYQDIYGIRKSGWVSGPWIEKDSGFL